MNSVITTRKRGTWWTAELDGEPVRKHGYLRMFRSQIHAIRAARKASIQYMDASAYDCPECGHPDPAHQCQERDRHEADAHDDRSDIK